MFHPIAAEIVVFVLVPVLVIAVVALSARGR